MWKYIQTDEMFVKRNDSELFHSDIYLGKDFSDGFRHWKYIKKEKRNGKWVYIYDDVDKKEYDANNKALKEASDKYDKAEKALKDYQKHADEQAFLSKYAIDKYENASFLERALNPKLKENRDAGISDLERNGIIFKDKQGRVKGGVYNSIYNTKEYSNLKDNADKRKEELEKAWYTANSRENRLKRRDNIQKAASRALVKTLNSVSNAVDKGKNLLKKLFKW